MSRRSRQSIHPAFLVAGLLALVAALYVGSTLFQQTGDPYRTTAPLAADAYLENSNSLRGNVYKLEGEILNVLGYSPATQDRLISVQIDSSEDIVPVVIPGELSHVNLQKGQRFHFEVQVDSEGILRARDLTKS